MNKAFIVGYDPGGDNHHGIAVLEVYKVNTHWNPTAMQIKVAHSLRDAASLIEKTCRGGRIVAAGIDTLTEWSSGYKGWRPADVWLRKTYPAVAESVVSQNSMYGAMAINGAAFLILFDSRFQSDCTMITEAHPKVCYFAMTGQKHDWANDKPNMTTWLLKELGLDAPKEISEDDEDHRFDAGVALLAALQGLNHDWNHDLHATLNDEGNRIKLNLQTHYWWPDQRTKTGRDI